MTSTLDLISTLSLGCQQVINKMSSTVWTDYTVLLITYVICFVFIRLCKCCRLYRLCKGNVTLGVMWSTVVLDCFKPTIGHGTEPLSSTAYPHSLSSWDLSNIIPFPCVFLPRWMFSKKFPPHPVCTSCTSPSLATANISCHSIFCHTDTWPLESN